MATFSQMELATAILDIVPQMDAKVVTIRIIMEKLAARFGVDLKTIRAQKAEIKQLVMNSYGQESDHNSDAEKENAYNKDAASSSSRERLQSQVSPVKRRPARKANAISDESEDEASEQDDEEEEARDVSDDSDAQASGSDSDSPKRKRGARSKSTPAKRKAPAANREKATKKKSTPLTKKPRQNANTDSSGIAALKEMARAARLLSPRVYGALKKLDSEEKQEELIRDLLRNNGIKFNGRYPQKREIDDVRKKKDLEKDLEGIDTSLIIEDTSSRPRRARCSVSYADQLRNRPASDEEEEEEEEEEEQEAVEQEDGEGNETKEKKPVVKRRKMVEERNDDEEEEEEDDDDAFEANDSDSSEAEF